jgi:hypothetical protein
MTMTMMRAGSVVSFLVGVSAMACGAASEQNESASLDGVYRPEGAAGPREITFEAPRYRLQPEDCDAPECVERGTFVLDARAGQLRFTVDGTNRTYALSFARLGASTPEGSGLKPATLVEDNTAPPPPPLVDDTGAPIVTATVTLVDRMSLAGNTMTRLQDIPDCAQLYGMGTATSNSQFLQDFERETQWKVRLRHIPGCAGYGVYECTSYDSYFSSWDNSDGSTASCNRACNQAGGFSDTAAKVARRLGPSCLAPDFYPWKKKRAPNDDSLDLVQASFVRRGGEIINGSCRCEVDIRYPRPK